MGLLENSCEKAKPYKEYETQFQGKKLYPCINLRWHYVYDKYVFDIRSLRIFYSQAMNTSYDWFDVETRFKKAIIQITALVDLDFESVLLEVFEMEYNLTKPSKPFSDNTPF